MTTLIIEIPDKVEKTLVELIELLGGKVIASDSKVNSSLKEINQPVQVSTLEHTNM